jgi:hypothetical protein
MANPVDKDYTAKEVQRRFEKALRAALNTPPKPLKSMTRKRMVAQQKKPARKANI